MHLSQVYYLDINCWKILQNVPCRFLVFLGGCFFMPHPVDTANTFLQVFHSTIMVAMAFLLSLEFQ